MFTLLEGHNDGTARRDCHAFDQPVEGARAPGGIGAAPLRVADEESANRPAQQGRCVKSVDNQLLSGAPVSHSW